MKQALIGLFLSLLFASCTVAQPLPTDVPASASAAALPIISPTPLSSTIISTPQPDATKTLMFLDATFTPTPLPAATQTPTAAPTRPPDIITDPSLPQPTGKIYFLWDPNPIPEERGIGELPKNNLYEAVFDSSSYNWYIESKIEMFGKPQMMPSPDSVNLAIVRYDDTNENGIVEPHDSGSDYVGDLTHIYVFNTIDSSLTHLTENQ